MAKQTRSKCKFYYNGKMHNGTIIRAVAQEHGEDKTRYEIKPDNPLTAGITVLYRTRDKLIMNNNELVALAQKRVEYWLNLLQGLGHDRPENERPENLYNIGLFGPQNVNQK